MPLILTDEYVKKNCMSQYPVPLKALKGLKPNRDKTPNYITKLGRTGIKQIDLPIYSPASVRSLANSISNISKLEREFVNGYLENMINSEMDELEDIRQILAEEEKAEELDDDRSSLTSSELARVEELLAEPDMTEAEMDAITLAESRSMDAEARAMAMQIRQRRDTTIYSNPMTPIAPPYPRAAPPPPPRSAGADTEQTRTAFTSRMPTKAEIDYIGGGDPREYGRRGGSRGGSGGEL